MDAIHNSPALVQVMAWRRTGDKPLSGLILTKFTDAYMRHYVEMSQITVKVRAWMNDDILY